MSRLPDWQRRFDVWLARAARAAAGQYEAHCGFFAADAVLAITGVDHAAEYRDAKTVAEGQERLVAAGFKDHVAFVDACLTEKDVAARRAGDIGCTAEGALLVIQSRAAAIGLGPRGTMIVPAARITRVWEV